MAVKIKEINLSLTSERLDHRARNEMARIVSSHSVWVVWLIQ